MKNITVNLVVATGGQTFYIPVPCRGNICSVTHVSNINSVATGTAIFSHGADNDDVNTVTIPTDDHAAGVVTVGTPETDDKGLIFDPASSVAGEKVIKVVMDGTIHAGDGIDTFLIEYDDSAYVEQAASEA